MEYVELRDQICDICHRMWQLGWVAANDGNVSVKIDDNLFMATPTGISKSLMTPEKLVIIDEKGALVSGAPGMRPSSEIKMHMRCYRDRKDVGAVVHAHPPTATGFAVAHIPLDSYSMIETVMTLGSVPIAPYATPSTDEVPDSIAPFIQDHDVVLLENHGAVSMGVDLITAYYRMETLEHNAKISLTARLLGGEKEIPRKDIDRLITVRERSKITGRHPGYKKYNR